MKIQFSWYSLPEELRNKLMGMSSGFYNLKDNGTWIPPPGGYEPETIAILRTHATLSYDVFIPTVISMMQEGVLTAIFPVGMKIVDIVFYQFDKTNPFHTNAYLRAGLKSSMEILKNKE